MRKHPIKAADTAIFLRQFATLIAAGIPLIQSCELLEKSQEKPALRLMIYSIKKEILSGKNLFSSLQSHRSIFDSLTCQLIHIGECTGNLDKMLTIIAEHQEKSLAFKKGYNKPYFTPVLFL